MLNVAIIGSGGREHALAWKLSQSSRVAQIFVLPGNGGTSSLSSNIINVQTVVTKEDVKKFLIQQHVDLVVVGPEQPLVDGIVDELRSYGIACFGPSRKAARLEGSKAFSKAFMRSYDIPTGNFRVFTDYESAIDYVRTYQGSFVVKVSGLASGKGVFLPDSFEEAETCLKEIFIERRFGDSGNEVVIEERLFGEEASILAFCDGYTAIPLPAVQDHKRVFDHDEGPNTGGMGAYAPAPIVTPHLMETIQHTILNRTLKGMRKEGCPFVGILYAGLMITKDGPKVLEYNCRFGDPETQVLMPLLDDSFDLVDVFFACIEGRLDAIDLKLSPNKHAATVVLVSGGYPGSYKTCKTINFYPGVTEHGCILFHAGTERCTLSDETVIRTSGGRVIAVTSVADSLSTALCSIYQTIKCINFEGMHYRKDIGYRALEQGTSGTSSCTYADAGVDIDRGDRFVDMVRPLAKSTRRLGADVDLMGFAGLFDLRSLNYKDPLLVCCTDGVGTKLKIAQISGKHDTVGVDLVAMCVNDMIVQGAEPLVFLDYYASGKLNLSIGKQVLEGIAEGCRQANCALIGGETAEMPGMYTGDDYDLAGFSVGLVERPLALPQKTLSIGDCVLGLGSSGIHSNGFSLVRRLVERENLDYHEPCPFDPDSTLGHALLTPTRIYVRSCLPLCQRALIKAMAHITGGGLVENIPRVLPEDLAVRLDASQWVLPKVFRWLKNLGNLTLEELLRTYNCGIGMVLIVDPRLVSEITNSLVSAGESVYVIGQVVSLESNQGRVVSIDHTDDW